MWIVRLALRRPYTVAVFCFVILLLGGLCATRMQKDIFPAIDIPVVIVVWNYPGLSAEDMERRVVIISERAYSTTVNGVSRIESESIDGIGLLKVYFEPGTDIGGAIAQISSVSSSATRVMPPGITPPAVIQFNASNVPVAQMTLSSATNTEQELFDYGLNFVRIRLFTIPGLATPAPYGGKQREVVVDVDPKRASAYGLGTRDVVQALLSSNLIEPAGSIRVGSVEYDVTMNSSPGSIEEFARMPIKVQGGAEVRVGDVALVHDGFAPQTNIARVNGNRATYLAILKKSNASTLAVVDAARDALPLIRAAAPDGMEIKIDFDQSVFVRAAMSGVLREAAISSLLVSVMILAFLGSWRSVVVVSTSIPLSIFVALVGLFATGQSLNIMTLGGMALAIGMLVDDATVEIENIHRNRALGKPLTVAILDGASQIAVPALAATLTICIVFFPVVMLTGPAKYLFTPLALSVVFAMLASYVLSRTLVPSLSRMLMEHEHHGPPGRLGRLREGSFDALQRVYARVLGTVLAHRAFVVACSLAVVVAVGWLATAVGTDFFPDVDAGLMRLHVRAPAGTRVEETEHVIAAVEDRIRAVVPPAELSTINDNIGVPISYNLAFVQTDNIGGADADVLVALEPGHKPTAGYRRLLREDLSRKFPDVQFYFQAADIVSQVLNFGLSAPIDVEIEGSNLERSAVFARDLRDRIRAIPGAEDVRIAQVLDRPALRVDVDRDRAAQVGVTQHDVADNVLTTLSSSSLVAPSFWLNPKNNVNYFVVVQSPLDKIATVDSLMGMPVALAVPDPSAGARAGGADPGGAMAPYLRSVASLKPSQVFGVVNHDSVQRVLDVQCNVDGRDLGSVSASIQRQMDAIGPSLPKDMRMRLRGQSESMRTSFQSLGFGLVLASVLVYLLLVVLFQSWLDPFIIIFAVPGALVGVVGMLAATGTTLNVESLMGSIMAVGVAVSNSILLVSFANEVREGSHDMGPLAAALEAGKTRLRPVLMTALAMILGMLPMALGAGEGGEQNAPLGRAVIGGLLVATGVTLFFVPLVYSLLRRKAPRKGELDARFAAETAGAEVAT
jgi:multidrug efflux pump subunit AcrB